MPFCICIPESVRENIPALCDNWDPAERRSFIASVVSGVLVSLARLIQARGLYSESDRVPIYFYKKLPKLEIRIFGQCYP